MNKNSTSAREIKITPEAACTWIDSKIRSHELSSNSGKLWTVAINAMAAMRREDEPQDNQAMLDLMPELERRWCIANDDSKGETGRTYASRARAGLKAHLRFLENPSGFRFEGKPRVPGAAPRKRNEPVAAKGPARETEAATTEANAGALASIPIPGKGEFRFVPPDDLSRVDVMRIAWGLLTFCEDFDPASSWGSASGPTGIVPRAESTP